MGSQALPANLLWPGLLSWPQVLPGSYSSMGFLLYGATGPARSLLQHGPSMGSQPLSGESTCSGMGFSTGCRWRSAPLWTSTGCGGAACLSMIFSTGYRGISALALGAPPQPSFFTDLGDCTVLTPRSG